MEQISTDAKPESYLKLSMQDLFAGQLRMAVIYDELREKEYEFWPTAKIFPFAWEVTYSPHAMKRWDRDLSWRQATVSLFILSVVSTQNYESKRVLQVVEYIRGPHSTPQLCYKRMPIGRARMDKFEARAEFEDMLEAIEFIEEEILRRKERRTLWNVCNEVVEQISQEHYHTCNKEPMLPYNKNLLYYLKPNGDVDVIIRRDNPNVERIL